MIAAIAAAGVNYELASGGAGIRIEADLATAQLERPMNGVQDVAERPFDFGLSRIQNYLQLLSSSGGRQASRYDRNCERRKSGADCDLDFRIAPQLFQPIARSLFTKIQLHAFGLSRGQNIPT